MLAATFLAIFVVPLFFRLITDLWLKRARDAAPALEPAREPARD